MKNILFRYLHRVFTSFGYEKQFVFRFDIYDGSEQNLEIYDTNVVEYKFVNLGTTICYINEMPVYPHAAYKGFDNVHLQLQVNEMDVTIYKYRFDVVDFFGYFSNVVFEDGSTGIVPNENAAQPRSGLAYLPAKYNRLLVISKIKAKIDRTQKQTSSTAKRK